MSILPFDGAWKRGIIIIKISSWNALPFFLHYSHFITLKLYFSYEIPSLQFHFLDCKTVFATLNAKPAALAEVELSRMSRPSHTLGFFSCPSFILL